jgi:DNA-directed RNA polymerase subunit RPC12/RpoP
MTESEVEMKLIIDIDEADYHRIEFGFASDDDAPLLEKIFKNGTPLKTGHWIKTDKRIKDNLYVWKVTCCGREFIADADLKSRDNYCLNCGAKIESEEKT